METLDFLTCRQLYPSTRGLVKHYSSTSKSGEKKKDAQSWYVLESRFHVKIEVFK